MRPYGGQCQNPTGETGIKMSGSRRRSGGILTRESPREGGTGVHASILRLGRAIRASLQGDRKRRVEIAGEEVETLLGEDPPNAKEAWISLMGWYKDTRQHEDRKSVVLSCIKTYTTT